MRLARPSAGPKLVSTAAQSLVEGKARLVVDMPGNQHRRLKAYAALKGRTVKEIVLDKLAELDAEMAKLPKAET